MWHRQSCASRGLHAVSSGGISACCLSSVGTGAKSLASPRSLSSLFPGTGAELQDMFLPVNVCYCF